MRELEEGGCETMMGNFNWRELLSLLFIYMFILFYYMFCMNLNKKMWLWPLSNVDGRRW